MNRIDLAEKCSEYVEYIHSVFYGLAEPNKGFEHNFFLTMNLAQFSQKFKISETCLSLVKKSKKTLSLESEKGSDPRIGDESTFPKLCQSFLNLVSLSISHTNLQNLTHQIVTEFQQILKIYSGYSVKEIVQPRPKKSCPNSTNVSVELNVKDNFHSEELSKLDKNKLRAIVVLFKKFQLNQRQKTMIFQAICQAFIV